jgi:signal transduction histidine kinase
MVKSIIDDCLSVLIFKAQEKGIELSLLDSSANERSIVTDANRVKQIIINLLSNAIKYTQQGYVRVGIVAKEESGMLEIAVKDSGVGMSRLQLSRLFKPFTKIKSNRKLNKEGVGLGLAVSKNIAIALSGDISVKSETGKGSTFTLSLPLT